MKAGHQLRDSGIARVSSGREDWILYARAVAIEIAEARGQVTINDVREVVELPDGFPANVWGAVLRGDAFEPVGFCQATHPSAHARVIRIYKLKGAQHA
jgi:hypothetical protein